MPRTLRPLAVALPLLLLLGACGGGGDATQGSVREQVKEGLLDRNENDTEGDNLSEEEAGAIADCVARAFFESGDFSKEERNDATSALDGEEPDPDLAAKVSDVVERCEADPSGDSDA